MPGPCGCFGGRISEHAGGPQLPARGQRQLSGGGRFTFSFGAMALIWGICQPLKIFLVVTTEGGRVGSSGI